MKIHWGVWYLLAKDLIVFVTLYYWYGQNAALWWVAFNGFLYGIVAVNKLLLLEGVVRRGRYLRS
jgi:hypothetical protein